MPNHVTHRVVVTGPAEAVAQFKNTFIVTTRDRDDDGVDREFTCLDFEVLVPMPEAIRNTESSSTVSDGLLILGRPDIRDDFGLAGTWQEQLDLYLSYPWSSPEPIFAALADRPEARGLTITIHGFDEGWNFAFVGSIHNGHYLGEYIEASEALYQQVYARPAPAED